MTYYDELRGKILGYESRFNEKPTNVMIGYQLIDWFIDFVYQKESFYNAEIVNIFGVNYLLKIEGLEVSIDNNIPYSISVYKEEKKNKTTCIEDVKLTLDNRKELEELARKERLRKEKAERRKKDDKMNDLLTKLLFNKEERMEIMNITQKKANEIDRDLKDLKLWIEFGEYIRERGDNEDEL